MAFLHNTIQYFKETNLDNKLILLSIIALFLPYSISFAYLIFLAIYIIIRNKKLIITNMIKKTPGYIFLLLTVVYLLITSLFHLNWLGAANSLGAALILFIYLYYRSIITKELFSHLINFILIVSIFAAIYSLFEQLYYLMISNELTNYLDISNKPHLRVHAFFYNANFYALILVFIEILCVYKILETESRIYYWIGFFNLFILYLTGSRFAWLALGIGLIFMAIMVKKLSLLIITLIICIILVILLFYDIPIIPRIAKDGISLERRSLIYQAAWLMDKDNWLFGVGPLGYQHEWPNYIESFKEIYGVNNLKNNGIAAPHAHNLFLESLVSYGMISVVLFILYFINLFKELRLIRKKYGKTNIYTLIITFIIATVLSNILDLPIMWVQTSMIFLFIIGSSAVYINNQEGENNYEHNKINR